ncbi:hypothetical protein [Synechococcus sp. N32]|uniref:hypothetical protein n=1 Tax=Synechococcus sp. N32 TaxID=2575514 RepID=UPI000E0F7C0F|nr:hypothetical protein [Synechococcus sp. N32]
MAHRTVKPFFKPSRPCAELKLGHRSLYIIPSRFGALWIAAAGLLLLVAIQTGSNSTLLLAFLMLGLMLLAMFLTHDTLQGLTLRCAGPSPAFAGEPAEYPLQLESSAARPRCSLRVQGHAVVVCDRIAAGTTTLTLPWVAEHRGWQLPSPVQIETIAPLGLFICWGRWQPQQPQLIWPRRRSGPVAETQPPRSINGLEEWQDLRPVREGERPALVDWASAARGRPLQAKVFNDPEEPEVILAPAPGVALELAREHLADRIWRLHHGGACYGLQIQGLSLAPSKGVRHRDACLEALATA